ncbi:putative Alpha-amylase AMY3 [Besnoitia besnoiti]|uniref:Putative Alpha-amylase AMY3 n=1 Tax=Besnoitia besnoiti TaxID=94643 RepID=A0A2A9M610_BESBE|nr:putative Alpha-amylase AMY3 [Besnoitia besnoiti]PFH33379.1 putative Alpha-amylase AMY3 [Besnoitia besnoiti]
MELVPEPTRDRPQGIWSLLPSSLKAAASATPAKLWMARISQPSLEFLLHDGEQGVPQQYKGIAAVILMQQLCDSGSQGRCWDKAPGGEHYWIGAAGRYLLHNGKIHTLFEPPGKPALLRSVEVGNSHATIAWNPPTVAAETVTAYNVYRVASSEKSGKPNGAAPARALMRRQFSANRFAERRIRNPRLEPALNQNWDSILIASVDSDVRVYSDHSLTGLSKYRFYVKALNQAEQEGASSDEITVRTGEPGKPSAPSELTCNRHSKKQYNLNSKYGSLSDLKELIRTAAHQYQLSCCVDVVANHRSATKQDRNGHWTVFEDPQWGSWAIVCNNLQGYAGEGGLDTGTLVECAPDLDHTNPQVQTDVKKWLLWLIKEIGYTAIRLDMAGGYGVRFQKDYVDSVDKPFTVGEYWDGRVEALVNYVRAGQGSLAAFDFALYYVLKRCVESQNFQELNAYGRINGLIGIEPQLAVTFIENHDTDHLDYCSTFGGGNLDAVLQGYAFILTHPGVPSVYWNHFSDYGQYCRQKLQELCDVRVHQHIHSTSGIFMARTEWGLYAAYISPETRFCQPATASVAVKIGFKDWSPQGPNWGIATCGMNYCVWTRNKEFHC